MFSNRTHLVRYLSFIFFASLIRRKILFFKTEIKNYHRLGTELHKQMHYSYRLLLRLYPNHP